jgi:hypothetical protein
MPVFLAAMLAASAAHADAFVVTKSENRNEVRYAVRLDGSCQPVGSAPVTPYWRMVEKGGAEESLLGIEEPAYGVAWQSVSSGGAGGSVRLALRAVPDRVIRIDAWRVAGGCAVVASTMIEGVAAALQEVHVTVGFLGPAKIEVLGNAREGGRPLHEVLR